MSNIRKLLSAYKTIAISLLLIIIIHILHWVREFNAAKIMGHEHVPIRYSFEIPMMSWNLAPYLLMIVYLLNQQRLLKKGAINVIDTSLVVTASVTGVFLFFFIDIINLDGLGYFFGHILLPIIQLVISVIIITILAMFK